MKKLGYETVREINRRYDTNWTFEGQNPKHLDKMDYVMRNNVHKAQLNPWKRKEPLYFNSIHNACQSYLYWMQYERQEGYKTWEW